MTTERFATKVDVDAPLEFQYASLGIIDVSIQFVYRFVGPITTAWLQGSISMPTMFYPNAYQIFALKQWNSVLIDTEERTNRIKDETERQQFLEVARKLKRDAVKIVECDIVPKPQVKMAEVSNG